MRRKITRGEMLFTATALGVILWAIGASLVFGDTPIPQKKPVFTSPIPQSKPHNVADPGHWYPNACCDKRDCFVVPLDDVDELPNGWYLNKTGEMIPYTSERAWHNDSTVPGNFAPDGFYHRCTLGGDTTRETREAGSKVCFWPPYSGI